MSVQVQFLEADLVIISIPIEQYPLHFHSIVKLVLKSWKEPTLFDSQIGDNYQRSLETFGNEDDSREEFCTVSLTPTECSIICHEDLLDSVFGDSLNDTSIVKLETTYTAIKIDADGSEDSTRRILDLSTPLSKAGIPIFFVSSYFSDYVLVPKTSCPQVQSLLFERNFAFSKLEDSYIALKDQSPTPELPEQRQELHHFDLKPEFFGQFSKLLVTGARPKTNFEALELAIVKSLLKKPPYFSLTTYFNEMSFLLDEKTSKQFGEVALLGSSTDFVAPVFFDLRSMPVDVVGVVAEISQVLKRGDIAMNYLSTALSSTVLVGFDQIETVKQIFHV